MKQILKVEKILRLVVFEFRSLRSIAHLSRNNYVNKAKVKHSFLGKDSGSVGKLVSLH